MRIGTEAHPLVLRLFFFNEHVGPTFHRSGSSQVELAKERRAEPLDPQWPPFRPGNPGSFRRGLATLPNAIAASLGLRCHGSGGAASEGADEGAVSDGAAADGGEACRVRLRWNLTSLERRPAPTPREATSEASGEARDVGGPFVATFATPGGARTVLARSVVSTVPLHALRGVLPDLLPAVDEACAAERANVNRTGLYYSPVASVAVRALCMLPSIPLPQSACEQRTVLCISVRACGVFR